MATAMFSNLSKPKRNIPVKRSSSKLFEKESIFNEDLLDGGYDSEIPEFLIPFYNQVRFSVKKYVVLNNAKLKKITRLEGEDLRIFEKLYKLAYTISYYNKKPSWIKYHKAFFFGDRHTIVISKEVIEARAMLGVYDIFRVPFTYESLMPILVRLDKLLVQMLMMYNKGINRTSNILETVKVLYSLNAIDKKLRDQMYFVGEIYLVLLKKLSKKVEINKNLNVGIKKAQKNKSHHYIKQIKLSNGKTIHFNEDTELATRALVVDIYVKLVKIYMTLQSPFLVKFYLMWEQGLLDQIEDPKDFYSPL